MAHPRGLKVGDVELRLVSEPQPVPLADVTARELMERIRGGDTAALDELLHRNWRPLVLFAMGFVQGVDAAEDVVQDVFVRVWQRRREWEPTGSVRAYLYRITRNLSLNEQRARGVRERSPRFARGRTQRMAPVTPAEHLEADELKTAVDAAVAALPERRRQVFILARYHGLSRQQIAEVMGISPQTVGNQLTSALATLRQGLAPFLEE